MQIEIIIGCDMHPDEVAEYAIAAERAGVRTLWHSNLPNGWDPFIGLSGAAQVTSRIKLGVLALSPYEMHPVRIAYSIISLNELAEGRAILGLGGGGAMALATTVRPAGESLDFSIFGAKEIRDVLKNKAHCLRAGFAPSHVIIATFNEIRDHYILRVGLPTYLSQMLGDLATTPMRYCTLYSDDGRRIEINLNGSHNQPIQRFIAKCFGKDDLPFKVEVRRGSKPGRAEVRFL